MERKIKSSTQGFRTQDGAGVSLVRVLGRDTVKDYDPFLMLDSFDSEDPSDYMAGFPMHPHRGIETITYLKRGRMTHRDSLGSEDTIGDSEVQWMTTGSGILHEEMPEASERMLGVQLWLNLPRKDKMCRPTYNPIKADDFELWEGEGVRLELIAGTFKELKAYQSRHLPLDFYHLEMEEGAALELPTREEATVVLFTLLGSVSVSGEKVPPKTAVVLTEGDHVRIEAEEKADVLFLQSDPLKEEVAWGGPIVMNEPDELRLAFAELQSGRFLKHEMTEEA